MLVHEVELNGAHPFPERTWRLGSSWPRLSLQALTPRRWTFAIALVAVLFGVAAFWITLGARFLAYPGWLAVQKADFILGPISVGLYWRYRRPKNRLGLFLIALGLFGLPYILESTTAPVAFGIGVLWEYPMFLLTEVVILSFPHGRLDGRAERLILALAVTVVVLGVVFSLTSPQLEPSFSISSCRAACPANGLAIWAPPSWTPQLADFQSIAVITMALATAGLLVWRFATGTPPRRRALAIGAPIALVFLLMQATYRTLVLVSPGGLSPSTRPMQTAIQWTFAGARASVWYGFLLALIAAELFAGRVLRDVVGKSLGRPSLRELEGMLRGPLADPGLRLAFWREDTHDWAGADGATLERLHSDQARTVVKREERPAAAIVHDTQLAEDPELLQAAGAVALLALENAELEAAWQEAVGDLRDSRARITRASDRERRKLERDLHDGAQQRLMVVQIKLRAAQERVEDTELARQLDAIGVEAAEAVDELRTLAHGIYPPVLRSGGLVMALRSVAMRVPIPIAVTDEGIGRCSPAVEASIYFCTAEAIQNVIKHAGSHVRVAVSLGRDSGRVHFAITDDGVGMGHSERGDGDGLIGMRDRVGAVGGELEIISSPSRGTTVRGTIPAGITPRPTEQSGGSG